MTGSFQTNGDTTGAVPAASITGPRGTLSATVSQSSTIVGRYTVSLPYGITFPEQPWVVHATPSFAALTNWFQVEPIGAVTYANGILSFDVQCHRVGTVNAPTNVAGNRVNFTLVAGDTIGK